MRRSTSDQDEVEAEEHDEEYETEEAEDDAEEGCEPALGRDALPPEEADERARVLESLREGRRQIKEEGRALLESGADETQGLSCLPQAPWSRFVRDKARPAEVEEEDEDGDTVEQDARPHRQSSKAERGEHDGLERDTDPVGTGTRLPSPRRSPPQKLIRQEGQFPRICLLGRPNVGKSSLFNKLKDKEDLAADAIVRDEDGTTRDRHYAFSVWRGCPFVVVDTGGLIFEEDRYAAALYAEEIRTQVQFALAEATCAIFVVDGRHGLAGEDEVIADFLRRAGTPVVVCVNKTENYQSGHASAQEFWKLGLGQPFPCSAIEGVGLADLLDACFEHFPPDARRSSSRASRAQRETERGEKTRDAPDYAEAAGPSRQRTDRDALSQLVFSTFAKEDVNVAIVGRPNVGKSQLLNRLLGVSRSLVSPEAGTTRDAVDELVERDSVVYRLVDTAGIRRARVVKAQQGTEFVMVKRAERALTRCDVCLLVCDAERGLVKQDVLLAKRIEEEGRAAVIVMNKWDTVDTEATAHHEVATYIRSVFYPLRWASIVCVSALTGKNASSIWPAINEAFQQVSIQPPTIVVFCNKAEYFPDVYRLYLDFSTRTAFNFHFTPIKWLFREKRRRELEKVSRSKSP
ncbi:hypothetical protein NCLIV_011480 [Neospora caninum Liverpool]|uniref:GTPase Der n=1 Tax=Neospora caninum (strain Liverpool) TaxID=572307 RepID=F0VAJ3_NEOCL|nr:hypothetical protein NCLIV_011480 [Neospora caninum Liverpool]CBZ50682.1 hypothetical protein NCLIV_011480 [Neospora caninum Liverpool]|eukprot:XP_003880715.1 hypothetical protein NCLIV_011480 [Neospora caninum Liverpool]